MDNARLFFNGVSNGKRIGKSRKVMQFVIVATD